MDDEEKRRQEILKGRTPLQWAIDNRAEVVAHLAKNTAQRKECEYRAELLIDHYDKLIKAILSHEKVPDLPPELRRRNMDWIVIKDEMPVEYKEVWLGWPTDTGEDWVTKGHWSKHGEDTFWWTATFWRIGKYFTGEAPPTYWMPIQELPLLPKADDKQG